MQSYPLSSLAAMTRRIDAATFARAYPYCWLVLERGAWRENTLAPAANRPEPLAVPLTGGVRAGQLTFGRGPGCDIVLGDASVSSTHLLFMEAARWNWTVRDAGSRNGTWFGDLQLTAGTPCVLRDGGTLRVGSVVLSYHTPEGFFARLQTVAARSQPAATPVAPPVPPLAQAR